MKLIGKLIIQNSLKCLFLINLVVISFYFGNQVKAASLYFSPSSGTYEVGKTFTVNVYVSSEDQAMNAVASQISFPTDRLEMVSFIKTGSVMALWAVEPTFSNESGLANFEGVILNPGYIGSSAKIITLVFKAKIAGNAVIDFTTSQVLANDGYGTNILSSKGKAQFNLIEEEKLVPKEQVKYLQAPTIYSPTHADQNKWYSNSNPNFTWKVPAGVTGVRILTDKSAVSVPVFSYKPSVNEKELSEIEDGVWYFHVRFNYSEGLSAITHYVFQIDTIPPEPFTIKLIDANTEKDTQSVITFKAIDAMSGIDYYRIKIGDGEFITLALDDIKNDSYTLPSQLSGKNKIIIQAFDKAGNQTQADAEFTIKSIDALRITSYPDILESGMPLIVRGSTYGNSLVTIWLQEEQDIAKSFNIKSDEDGNFVFAYEDKIKDGIVKLWAEVTDKEGNKSQPSEELTIIIKSFSRYTISSWKDVFSKIVIPILILSLILQIILWFSYRKYLKV